MTSPGQSSAKPSKDAATKLAVIQAKIGTNSGPDTVKILLGELQNALQEVDEKQKLETTLTEQVQVLAGKPVPLVITHEINSSDHNARTNRVESIAQLKTLYNNFNLALYTIRKTHPGINILTLVRATEKLHHLTQRIDTSQKYLDNHAEAQINHQKKLAAAANIKAALSATEAALCNKSLSELVELSKQVFQSGSNGPSFDEKMLSKYLQIASDNITNGQALIDRIKCLESCNRSNKASKKRKLCDGSHVLSPELIQDLIKRVADEMRPQNELFTKIIEMLSAVRAAVQARSPGGSPTTPISPTSLPSTTSQGTQTLPSAQQSSSGPQPDVVMGNTGPLEAILKIDNAILENGPVLLSRIACLESQLHALKNHPPGSPSGSVQDCSKELEKMRKQLRDENIDLKRRLENCLQFKTKVLSAGGEEVETEDDLKGLDTKTLIDLVLLFQGKVKDLAISLAESEEARKGDAEYDPSDQALDESQINIDCHQKVKDLEAEVARLKHEIANLEVGKTHLRKQLEAQEYLNAQGGDDEDNDDHADRTEARYPLGSNDFCPNDVCNDEIEALNNQATTQKQVIGAMEQQAALDKLEIVALKDTNTDKSLAYRKFVALIEKLRGELADLHAKLAECRFPVSLF